MHLPKPKLVIDTNTNVIFAEPYFRWGIIEEDPDDNKFADLALSATADAMVTFDKHFSVFKNLPFPTLNIVHPKKFGTFMAKWS
ncbi:PIN domain-containing protein [Parapedobacter tibetensis]|uniref:PIN domain-containing protein n=1 Tax=Parapedobacter tibetensis TaxID=2972951 RepID=UPI00214D1E15|nr:PIN domain-containing protein [Parapedobacter tibetensis]